MRFNLPNSSGSSPATYSGDLIIGGYIVPMNLSPLRGDRFVGIVFLASATGRGVRSATPKAEARGRSR
jgi:hypothetical protein